MSLNYRADKVDFPSVRGIEKSEGAPSTVGGPGCITKFDVTNASQNITLSTTLLGKWLSIQAKGCTLNVTFGQTGDTVTAVANGAAMEILDGQIVQGLVTVDTLKIGVISTGSFTGGMVYWASERNS